MYSILVKIRVLVSPWDVLMLGTQAYLSVFYIAISYYGTHQTEPNVSVAQVKEYKVANSD